MIDITIPGRGSYTIEYVILDLNGTIALDGKIIRGVMERVVMLSEKVQVMVVTADTNRNAEKLLKNLPVTLLKIEEGKEDEQKRRVVKERGKSSVISIGNGCNDISMLRESAIGICVVGREGASSEAIAASDLTVPTINDALDILLKPHRLMATLRR
jgi:P-type E1-E2 ATPase